VALYLGKSIFSIAAIFGILKAGGVYVPLDINAPEIRIEYIMDNCGVRSLITSPERLIKINNTIKKNNSIHSVLLSESIPSGISGLKTKIFSLNEISGHQKYENPGIPLIWEDLAYILYTSGSTGKPKGVMISHLNALNFVRWAYETFQATSDDIFSNHAPYHFDLSVLDIYVAFMAGATLKPVPEEYSYFPYRLAEWIEQNKISIWYSVPSILSMMLNNGKLQRFTYSNLRVVLFAGEVFPVKYLRELMKLIPHPKYYNLFGPTETNVVTYYPVLEIPENQSQPIPIGQVCENMEILLINENGEIISQPGVRGEIHARGANVAKGYWGDAEKTDSVFIHNFQQNNYKETIYKTGDIAMKDNKGNYIFFGRKDHMIKSRGYRIELGEIESALYSHPNIIEAVIVPIPDEEITNRLKAFLALKDGIELGKSDIMRYCSKILPKYMIPDEIEFRKSLPKNPHGKIDRTQLAGK
jgi:amino acid adenylation domain-containing protein